MRSLQRAFQRTRASSSLPLSSPPPPRPCPRPSLLSRRPLSLAAHAAEPTGFAGLPIRTSKDWDRESEKATVAVEKIIRDLTEGEPEPRLIVHGLDAISDHLCRIADAAEFCRNINPSRAMSEGATRAVMGLQHVIATLNAHRGLYDLSLKAIRNKHELTTEEFRVIDKLRIEFEHNGVHLSKPEQEKLFGIQQNIQKTQTAYMGSLHEQVSSEVTLPLDRLPAGLIQRLKEHKRRNAIWKEKEVTVKIAEGEMLHGILLNNPHEEVRQRVHKAFADSGSSLSVLEKLVSLRQDLAEALGFPSYSHLSAWQRVLKEPQDVNAFLEKLSEKIKPKVQDDLSLLRQAKAEAEGPTSAVQPWDSVYESKVKRARAGPVDQSTLQAFTLQNTLNGIFLVAQRLFGLRFEDAPTSDKELWSSHAWKTRIIHPERGDIGVIYWDLFERPEKFQGAATFPIRLSSMHAPAGAVLGFVMNLSAPSPKASLSSVKQETLLSVREVETMFHEFGHALHSLLSTTKLQHVSGTRTYLDFVETPSTLFENFAFDGRVLPLWAINPKTGVALTADHAAAIQGSVTTLSSLDMERQIFFASLDTAMHSGRLKEPLPSLARRISSVSSNYNSSSFAKMSHFVGYGAAYYSYLYSSVHSATIWRRLFAQEPLDGLAGRRLESEVLRGGGAIEPSEVLVNLTGKSTLDLDALLDGHAFGLQHS